MMFGHEHIHPPSTTSHMGPTPLWAKVACCASLVLVLALIVGGFR